MGSSFKRCFMVALVLTALSQASFARGAADEKDSGHEPKTIVGAWFNTVQPTLRPAFVGLGTFSSDGGVVNTTSDSLPFPTETPGFGRWTKTGPQTYAITFFTLVGAPDGTLAATGKVRATLTLSPSGDEFTGVFQVDLVDPSGALIVSDTGTVTGTRIKVEPL